MTEKENRFALRFEFPVKTLEKKDDDKSEKTFYEFFIPYSAYTLIQSDFLSAEEEIILSNYIADYAKEKFTVENSFSSLKEADWVNQNEEYEEMCLFDYCSDFFICQRTYEIW